METMEEQARTLSAVIIETLLPGEDEYVGRANLSDGGWWVRIGKNFAYLGATYEAAILTAQLGDWFIPARDGASCWQECNQWWEARARTPLWEEEESTEQEDNRQLRTKANLEFTAVQVPFTELPRPYHPEMDTGESLSPTEMEQSFSSPVTTMETFELEFIALVGQEPALFLLDDDNEYLTPVRLLIRHDGYSVQKGEQIPASLDQQLRTVGRLILDEQHEFLAYHSYSPGEDRPTAIYRKEGDQIVLDRLRIG